MFEYESERDEIGMCLQKLFRVPATLTTNFIKSQQLFEIGDFLLVLTHVLSDEQHIFSCKQMNPAF